MKALIIITFCLFTATCFAQTKLISFRSHSGSNKNFRIAVEHNLFDIGRSNLGIATQYFYKIDTVILMSKSKIIVLRKLYETTNLSRHKYYYIYRDTLTKENAGLFFKAKSVDSLKAAIHKKYFQYKTDSTVFIGFDRKFKRKKA